VSESVREPVGDPMHETGAALLAYDQMWAALAPIGRDERTGGYHRSTWSAAGLACDAWFRREAGKRDLTLERDGNGNVVAWWWPAGPGSTGPDPTRPESGGPGSTGPGSTGPASTDHRTGGVVTGSHLDSVPDGGAYDGPLGVVSALAAVDLLRARSFVPARPLGIAVFAEEEGARFGVACLGSRLLTGELVPERAGNLRDREGRTLPEVMRAAGQDSVLGASGLLHEPVAFVELHVEQGRGLADLDAPVGLASGIWPHGRWRFTFDGEANHAGTTAMADRRDPMLTYAMTALAANKRARLRDTAPGIAERTDSEHEDGGARATFGRVEVRPNGANGVPSRVTAWLDARAADEVGLRDLVGDIRRQAAERAARDRTTLEVQTDSFSPAVQFDAGLLPRLADRLAESTGRRPPVLATQAGHDAGVLATAGVPTAMLFVRNPTGVSHAPAEYAAPDDCHAGVVALADVLQELLAE
jgi:N-carbamoyl-L-amino-acid hydrolase